ncbi:hypothetical protein EIN_118200 [Entamoeba invadens IP1]|uniref:Ribonuclease H n=1 Tax=Entamoeba invadens IP1 TaxID=370355 RepID=L7FNQ0_ENTIV|nr:hypothetical protein EIN_118200 [Entamoeba invadens IP1]ELP92246.1 hypothetical protein EIN_118200 [Entamoeba invadens IP1]|eukprot:XP_004259017.1 hypothetical protein EIN_118200 [Entamoeba invadens IP1]
MPKKSQSKVYVVFEGRVRGLYATWAECDAQVKGFSGAKYKSYPSREDAEEAYIKHIDKFPIAKEDKRAPPEVHNQTAELKAAITEILHRSVSSNTALGLFYKEIKSIKGLYKSDTNELIVPGEESIDLYKKGFQYLEERHLLELGYKLYPTSTYANALQEIDKDSLYIVPCN